MVVKMQSDTYVYLDISPTELALYLAAPKELAIAPFT